MRLYYKIKNRLYDIWLEFERVFLNTIIKIFPETIVDPDSCEHQWEVHSVDYDNVWLELVCFKCQSHGLVQDPNSEEWNDAYGASMSPYEWQDNSRVLYVRCFGKTE